ncbi:DUF2993 domain-containing protein [Actinocorallia longicatena]|uniref:DUF2993 domain-containing protein n=1 Tax=Actinocorallia longicatena TaxID=111803 RepID=A0ABP6QP77_9ACTN
MRKFLLVLLVLVVVGLVGSDRFVKARAESEIAKQVAAQYALPKEPSVEIGGFPFLTQAVSGKYERIDVAIGDYTQQGVTVQDVRIRLTGLNAPLGDLVSGEKGNLRAREATASAVIPYGYIQQQVASRGVTKVSRSGNAVRLDGTYAFMGLSTPVGVVVSIRPTKEGILVTPQSVDVVGGLVQVPIGLVQEQLRTLIPVTGLPMGSRITKVEPTDAGLRVTGEADNVPLNEPIPVS